MSVTGTTIGLVAAALILSLFRIPANTTTRQKPDVQRGFERGFLHGFRRPEGIIYRRTEPFVESRFTPPGVAKSKLSVKTLLSRNHNGDNDNNSNNNDYDDDDDGGADSDDEFDNQHYYDDNSGHQDNHKEGDGSSSSGVGKFNINHGYAANEPYRSNIELLMKSSSFTPMKHGPKYPPPPPPPPPPKYNRTVRKDCSNVNYHYHMYLLGDKNNTANHTTRPPRYPSKKPPPPPTTPRPSKPDPVYQLITAAYEQKPEQNKHYYNQAMLDKIFGKNSKIRTIPEKKLVTLDSRKVEQIVRPNQNFSSLYVDPKRYYG